MSDVIGELRPLTWRGKNAPARNANYTITHRQAKHATPYIDGAAHQWTGRECVQFTAELVFSNTMDEYGQMLGVGESAPMYPDYWSEYRETLFDGLPGDLEHPDLGMIRAVVQNVSVQVDAMNRGGIAVSVAWEETTEDNSAQTFTAPTVGAKEAAAAADAAMAALGIDYPDGMGDDPSLLDTIGQFEGAIMSVGMGFNGVYNKVRGQIEAITNLVDFDGNPAYWPLRDLLETAQTAVMAMHEEIKNAGRPTHQSESLYDMSLDELADWIGNTPEEFMTLNPQLIRFALIPKGTVFTYYTE